MVIIAVVMDASSAASVSGRKREFHVVLLVLTNRSTERSLPVNMGKGRGTMLLVLSVARSQDRNKQLDLWKQTTGDLIIHVFGSESLTLNGFCKKLFLEFCLSKPKVVEQRINE